MSTIESSAAVDHLSEVTGRKRIMLWLAVLSGLLLAMLDQTIVGTALPQVVADLGGRSWYVWVFTAYLVPATVLLPVFARLSDRHGRQRILLTGMGLFVVGSALCAVAQSVAQVAVFRGVQGAGAAALEALSFMLITELAGPTRRAAAQAALAGIMTFSFIGGPLVGGLLSDTVGWRWVFLVNVPLGLVAIAVVARVLPAQVGRSESREVPLDIAGILALTGSMAAMLVGLSRHLEVGAWFDLRTGGLIGAGLGGLVGFVALERRAAAPVLPLRLFTNPTTSRLLVAGSTATFGLYASMLVIPRYLQQAQGVSATESGLRVYPLLVGLLVAVNIGATVIQRRNASRGPLICANAVVIVAALGFATIGRSTPGALLLVLMTVLGLGLGPALSGIQIAIGRFVPPRDLGAAMGTLLLGRQVGGLVALAVVEALYTGRLQATGSASEALGWSMFVVPAAGAVVAAAAISGLRHKDAARPEPLGSLPGVPPTSAHQPSDMRSP
jgi:EmrB/QacA subfamily drug resistance transporter